MTDNWQFPSGVSNPTTPYWLPYYSPGQISGQAMQMLPTKVPSLQQWGKTNASWKSGLSSYIDRAAGTPGNIASYEDLLSLMERMRLRRSPSRAAQWYPAQQW